MKEKRSRKKTTKLAQQTMASSFSFISNHVNGERKEKKTIKTSTIIPRNHAKIVVRTRNTRAPIWYNMWRIDHDGIVWYLVSKYYDFISLLISRDSLESYTPILCVVHEFLPWLRVYATHNHSSTEYRYHYDGVSFCLVRQKRIPLSMKWKFVESFRCGCSI